MTACPNRENEATSLSPGLIARRFESVWRLAPDPGRRPDPADFLPAGPQSDPAALLALIQADLTLRREAGEPATVEDYLRRFPSLEGGALVALIYEEYCLREEAGEEPDLAGYEARFPAVAADLRQVLEIHSLVRSGRSALPAPGPSATPFPCAGRTIAGFHLVEELGRGTFARVFLAEERLLADRPVALKVTRAASREPQALARLQHTHIVPVYSYRTDPDTGLHLLCMPYLGRVTLADVLAHPVSARARDGSDLVAALDQLGANGVAPDNRPAGRQALARRGYARAVAWWGARLAEALQHAHDHGVLHRDIKPSNVLITGDALPMLLDFNLARDSWIENPAATPSALGGTLAYMAPEHIEALCGGAGDRVDGRADVYALGVVLFEALTSGTRPFPPPGSAATVPEMLRRAAGERRANVPRLRASRPDVPPELDVVVGRCLAYDPADRYSAASELAADLQAVADDAPLRYAQEPLPGRLRRWVRRHRRRLALSAPPLLALVALAVISVDARLARLRLEAEIEHGIGEGEHASAADQLDRAADQFATAARLAASDPGLSPLRTRAAALYDQARRTKAARDRADAFFRRAEPLRFALLGFGGDPAPAARGVDDVLGLFSIPDDPDWSGRDDLRLLDEPRRARLLAEADELLFLWAVALDRGPPGDPARERRIRRVFDAARPFVPPAGPWAALRVRYDARRIGRAPENPSSDPLREPSARACFQWGFLRHLDGRTDEALAWLERAVLLRPDDFWSQFYLGFRYAQAKQVSRAIEHYSVAAALRPSAPWALFNRAQLLREQGDWARARADVVKALDAAREMGFDFVEARLESGLIRQHFGDAAGARSDDDDVIAHGGPYARAARLNRAQLDLDAGAVGRARDAYISLLADDPEDPAARLGRALLALRLGQAEQAEADLTHLLRGASDPAMLHAHRALARLALGRADAALADADAALGLRPSPAHERLRARALLAAGRDLDLFLLDDPNELDRLPFGGPRLATDLRASAGRLLRLARAGGVVAPPARRTAAVLLAGLGEPSALPEAGRALSTAPASSDSHLVRARIRQRFGDPRSALADVERGVILAPGDPRLLELRGQLLVALGRTQAALADFDRAAFLGARGGARASKAQALSALGRFEAARDAWTLAVAYDPEDPRVYLGRARALIGLRLYDDAVADLEQAAGWSRGRASLLAQTACTYLSCLPSRPDRTPRVFGLVRQGVAAWFSSGPIPLGASRPSRGQVE